MLARTETSVRATHFRWAKVWQKVAPGIPWWETGCEAQNIMSGETVYVQKFHEV